MQFRWVPIHTDLHCAPIPAARRKQQSMLVADELALLLERTSSLTSRLTFCNGRLQATALSLGNTANARLFVPCRQTHGDTTH